MLSEKPDDMNVNTLENVYDMLSESKQVYGV
jgi:hypothetical protein